jgi:cbb3-type cytochrome oxidase subunit 3
MQIHKPRVAAIAFVIVAIVLLTLQGSTSFFIIFPILLLLLGTSWYLYKELAKQNEEIFEQSIKYIQEEQEAQIWLKKSFVPKARKLAKKELRIIILASVILLISFIFLWSFFVSGLLAAILNTVIGFLFFIGFIIYTLYAPKEFTHVFKHAPRRYRRHSKNDWVHGYLLLLPFALVGFFLYSLTTTGEGALNSLFATIIFFFSYTLLFICLYCIWYLYKEYLKEREEERKKEAKEILKNNQQ